MKIRKDSWHYRLLKWSFDNNALVGFTTKNGVRYETAEEMKVATGFLPSPYHNPSEFGESLPRMSLCRYCRELVFLICFGLPLLGFMFICFSPIFLFACISDWWESRKCKQPKKQPKFPREPKTLLGKWLKAKKDKVCPILEYE